jgi:hypothetical protein
MPASKMVALSYPESLKLIFINKEVVFLASLSLTINHVALRREYQLLSGAPNSGVKYKLQPL